MSDPESLSAAQAVLVRKGRMLRGEEYYAAVLLAVVIEYCAREDGNFDSWGHPVQARAIRQLAEDGYIEIIDQRGDGTRIVARLTEEGRELLDWLAADELVRT